MSRTASYVLTLLLWLCIGITAVGVGDVAPLSFAWWLLLGIPVVALAVLVVGLPLALIAMILVLLLLESFELRS